MFRIPSFSSFPFIFLLLTFPFFTLSSSKEIMINSVRVDSELLDDTKSSSPVFLTFANTTAPVVHRFAASNTLTFENNEARAFSLFQELEGHTTTTQSSVRSFLTLLGVDFKPFWITNRIYIKNCPAAVVEALLQEFPEQLMEIKKEKVLPMLPTFDVEKVANSKDINADTVQPGIALMGAPQLWAQNITGKNVFVAVIDTGCNKFHKDLGSDRVKAEADKVGNTGKATDLHGHGTHCRPDHQARSGVIAGKSGTGMAPDANLYTCKACESAGCPQSSLISCGQWVACPQKNCAQNPSVASNSWGGGAADDFYLDVINAWTAAGICPVFAAGNAGPNCATLNSPGDYPTVVTVGAIDPAKKITSFSSRGPSTLTGGTKPNVVAPGSKIISCSNLDNSGYVTMSGTSMATPHLAGMAALLISQNPQLTVADLKSILINSCEKNLTPSGTTCGGKADSVFPNFVFGEGKPSCAKAMIAVAAKMQSDVALSSETN